MSVPADVVVIGGGPIGLAHAWALKKINPELQITVLERYEEYQRKHTLSMDHRQLRALMDACGATTDAELVALEKQLKANEHIRTTDLEKLFKKIAIQEGVQFVVEEVKAATFDEQIAKHTQGKPPLMIIGADGTHSLTSQHLFPAGNQIKHEFDYVLQCRFEIQGNKKSSKISPARFFQVMLRYGLIANEYVGPHENGKTPVTMQLMLTKEQFNALENLKAKHPKRPFMTQDQVNALGEEILLPQEQLPAPVQSFVNHYLKLKTEVLAREHSQIDAQSIKISVNEAPATHAKQIFVALPNQTHAVLVGDARFGRTQSFSHTIPRMVHT